MQLDIGEIFIILAGLFVIIGVGYLAAKTNVVSHSATPMLSSVLMRISLPCTIFTAMIRPYDPQFLTDGLIVMALCGGCMLVYIFLALWQVRLFHIPAQDAGAWVYTSVFFNAGFIGYPIALALFGEEGLSLSVILNVPLMVFCFSWGIYYVEKTATGTGQAPAKLWKALVTEANIALVLSMVCYVNQWTPPALILTPATYLANLTTPLSLLIVGISLAGANTQHLFQDKLVLLGTFNRLLLFPAITCGVLLWLNLDSLMLPALTMILLATPAPASAAAIIGSHGGNQALSAKITFLTSLLCMLTIPLWAMLF